MIDSRIESAVRDAVENYGQPEKLASRIIKWFEDVANGNESLEDRKDYMRRLDVIYEAVETEE